MTDTIGLQPIVNGNTQTVQEVVAQVVVNSQVGYVPVVEIMANGALNAQSNPLFVTDAVADSSLATIANNTAATVAQLGTLVANSGSVSNSGTVSITGTPATKSASVTINALDISVVTTGGTPVVALNAGHASAGGFLRTTNPNGFFVNQISAAGTVDGGSTIFVPANTTYNIIPNSGTISVNAISNSVTISGYGLS